MPRVKGPWFPSFDNPRDSTSGKRRYNFNPGTQSVRQVKRNLRNKLRNIIAANDDVSIAAFDRVLVAIQDEPDPEYSALHLMHAGLVAHEDTGEPWAVCMNYIMDKFDGKNVAQENHTDVQPAKSPEAGAEKHSRIGRLLRSLVPRSLRKGDAPAAEGDVDQLAGRGDAQSAQCDAGSGSQSFGESTVTAEAFADRSLHAGR